MAIPDQFTDLVKLNAYIGREYVDKQADKSDKSRGLSGGFDMYPGIDGMAGLHFERISTGSGGVNDCLVYAFLQATCPNFRCLTDANQKVVASNYRRTHLKNIALRTAVYSRKRETDTDDSLRDRQRRILARINSNGFLEDIEISILCEYYRIKILVFEVLVNVSNHVVSQSLVIYGGIEGNDRDDDPVFMIYNPGNFHFETVRVTGSYVIPFGTAETLRVAYQPQQDGANNCQHNVGDEIEYEGRRYYIVYRNLGDQGVCREYGLTEEREMALELKRQSELGTPAGAKFVSDNEMAYASRVVPAAAIDRAAPAPAPARPALPAFAPAAIAAKAFPKTPITIANIDEIMAGPTKPPAGSTEKEAEIAKILKQIDEDNKRIELLKAKIAAKKAAKGAKGGTRRKHRARRITRSSRA